jgi:hypothetical protein
MDLTWRDLFSTLALGLILIVYMSYSQGARLWLISSAWSAAAVILLIGLGGRAISVRGGIHGKSRELFPIVLRAAASALGVIALGAGLIALFGDSAYALKIEVMTSIAVWGALSLSHV